MKKNISMLLIVGIALIVSATPFLLQAQSGSGGNSEVGGSGGTSLSIELRNPFKQDTIQGLINVIVNEILIPIGGVIAVLMIMYAGFLYVTARGNPAQISKAHNALLWAVIGAAILLGAWVISEAIGRTIEELRV